MRVFYSFDGKHIPKQTETDLLGRNYDQSYSDAGGTDLPELELLQAQLKADDVLVVPRLIDLGTTLKSVAKCFNCAKREGWSIEIIELKLTSVSDKGSEYIDGFLAAANLHHHVQSVRSKEGIQRAWRNAQ